MTLRLLCVESLSRADMEASGAEWENPIIGEPGPATASEGDMDSSSAASPPPEEVATYGLDGIALILCMEELEQGGYFFTWPQPLNSTRPYSW